MENGPGMKNALEDSRADKSEERLPTGVHTRRLVDIMYNKQACVRPLIGGRHIHISTRL